MSHIFSDEQFSFTQPDGSKIKLRGWGNQYFAKFTTTDGQPVVKNAETGFFEIAGNKPGFATDIPKATEEMLYTDIGNKNTGNYIKSAFDEIVPRWQERRQEEKETQKTDPKGMAPAPPPHKTTGDYVGLVLPIQFPDVQGTIAVSEIDAFCNKPGYNGFGNNGSVSDYFSDNSGGKLHYKNIVAPYYTARFNRSYYTDESQPDGLRAQELIVEALLSLKNSGFDFSVLSRDNRNYVYAINAFYAGEVVNNWSKGLWPHQWRLRTIYDLGAGIFAADYQITNMGTELTLGTFCHENGHMICSFPDLYRYDGAGTAVGSYCLMCHGGVIDKKNPANIGAYLKYEAGWAKRVSLSQSGTTVTIQTGQNDFLIHQKDTSEYFIVEARLRTGRDTSIGDDGLAIWHVYTKGTNTQPDPLNECRLIQADGREELERGINIGDDSDLYDGQIYNKFDHSTVPASVWYDNNRAGFNIKNINLAGNTVTFDVL